MDEEKLKQRLGERILKFRKESDLTQEQLAEKLSVAHETVSRIEREPIRRLLKP